MNINDLISFIRVVESGTMTAAAKAEGVPKSTISRRISRLESDLGIDLLRRSTRHITLTDDGLHLHELASGAVRDLLRLEATLLDTKQTPRGRLTISILPELGHTRSFVRLLVAYRETYPEVEVDVRLESRVSDLSKENIDIGFRVHAAEIPGNGELKSRSFELPEAAFYATPSYLQKHGTPETLEELHEHDLIGHRALRQVELHSEKEQKIFTFPSPTILVNDHYMAQVLVESGTGIGLLSPFLRNEVSTQTKLLRILPNWSMRSGKISLVWVASQHLAPRIRAFVDMAVHMMKDEVEKPY